MSKKRTSDEANNDDEQTNEDSDLFQKQEGNKHTKRAKLNSSSDTTLQDLPNEQLQRILVKAVVMEVVGMRMAKCVWKEKSNPVINRLKDVCLNWRRILSTAEFATEVHRNLDETDIFTVFPDRMEDLLEAPINFFVRKVTTLKEEIFMLCGEDDQQGIVNVYDRNNMAEVKDVIALPGTRPVDIEACNVSNCLYVLCLNTESECPSVLRVTKDEGHQYNSSPWISDLRLPIYTISVSKSGVLAVPNGRDTVAVSLYNTTGSLVKSTVIRGSRYVDKVIQKSNGNLVLACINGERRERVLTEISTDGTVQRQYKSIFGEGSFVGGPDKYGRMVISSPRQGIAILDSEFNLFTIMFLLARQPSFAITYTTTVRRMRS